MKLYKVQFSKHRTGQTYFERSLSWSSVTLLLVLCDDVKIVYKRNRNKITFIFKRPEENIYARIINVPDYLAKTVLSMEEWKEF